MKTTTFFLIYWLFFLSPNNSTIDKYYKLGHTDSCRISQLHWKWNAEMWFGSAHLAHGHLTIRVYFLINNNYDSERAHTITSSI